MLRKFYHELIITVHSNTLLYKSLHVYSAYVGWLNYAEPTIFLLFLFLFFFNYLCLFSTQIIKSKGIMKKKIQQPFLHKLLRLENEIEAVHNSMYE